MFWSAHIVVKAVMLGLSFSLWCWTIIFDKSRLFHKFKNEMENFEQIFWSGQSLEELYTSLSNQPNGGAAALFVAAMREWKRSFQQKDCSGATCAHRQGPRRIDCARGRAARIESWLLATVASIPPFIGLFDRVRHHELLPVNRSVEELLAYAGIAEALLATAIGLFAAIPALIAYNKFQGDVAKAQARLKVSPTSSPPSSRGRSTTIYSAEKAS